MEPNGRYAYMTRRFFGTMKSCFEQTDRENKDGWKVIYSDVTDAPSDDAQQVSVFVAYRREIKRPL